MNVLIIGGGIGGLTLALELHEAGIPCTVYEAAPKLSPLGVGINVLPHAAAILGRLGLESELGAAGIETQESVFFNRFGQLIHREPAGRFAGYEDPQFSIHRGDLQTVLLKAVRERMGRDAVIEGYRCTRVRQEDGNVWASFSSPKEELLPDVRGTIAVACDGVHSVIRKQFNPEEGSPLYSGINMWRGVTRWKPFLTGASMVRAGWLNPGKMVIYPIRDSIDEHGNQFINWVAEVETPHHVQRDWSRRGRIDDFIGAFEDWHFDWLDVPAMIRASDSILEYPMVDQDPIEKWSHGRVTLLGDAAHPMVPRGSNGAGQAILDARALRVALSKISDPAAALQAYEDVRLPATSEVVRTNRSTPPDFLLKEVLDRTGDAPFNRIEDVISIHEIEEMSQRYKKIAGFSKEALRAAP